MEEVTSAAIYEALQAQGLAYGPAFQGIDKVWRGEAAALGGGTFAGNGVGGNGRLHDAPGHAGRLLAALWRCPARHRYR